MRSKKKWDIYGTAPTNTRRNTMNSTDKLLIVFAEHSTGSERILESFDNKQEATEAFKMYTDYGKRIANRLKATIYEKRGRNAGGHKNCIHCVDFMMHRDGRSVGYSYILEQL